MRLGLGLGITNILGGGPPAPVLTSLDYDLADTLGGDSVTITGTGLGDATAVDVDGDAGTITAQTDTTLTFTTPAKTAGTYDVVVTGPGGDSDPISLEFWDPGEITGIARWFDVKRGLSTSGSNVTAWVDQEASQSWTPQASFEPVYSATGFGTGRPGIVFTKGADFLEHATGYTPTSGISVFAALKTTDNTASPGYANEQPNTWASDKGGSWAWSFGTIQGDLQFSRFDGVSVAKVTSSGITANDGDAHLFGATHAVVGGTITLYSDNVSVGTGTKTWVGNMTFNVLGAGYTYNDKAGGTLGAMVVVSGVISSGDRGKLYKWAQIRFGVA